jgi:hypothetical protein
MGQIPGEAKYRSAIQEIPRLLWNTMLHYLAHGSLQMARFLGYMRQVHTHTIFL